MNQAILILAAILTAFVHPWAEPTERTDNASNLATWATAH